MEAFATVLTYAIPGFISLIIIEYIASRIMGRSVNRAMDTISSLSSGMTNTLKDLMGLSIVIISYSWMVDKIALFQIDSPVWLFVLAFILIDFASYWSHRFNHEINVMWNRHIVHHSSEEFNLSCALRQSISGIIGVYFFLYIPMALIGIPAKVVAITAPLHLFAQFWYHTRLIGRMGILEHIIVTPSHHRVHHAINPEYIDKNYAAIFILWDKWFGTFQEEMDDVPAVYGVKKPVKTWNPIIINWQHMWLLAKDAWRTKRLWDKVRLWFMPTGWRPRDMHESHPVQIIENPFQMEKYSSNESIMLRNWSWAQLILHNVLMYYILMNIANFDFLDVFMYAAFLMVSIFAYTSLMDKSPLSIPFEALKVVMGFYLIVRMDGWFNLDTLVTGGSLLIQAYLVISLLMNIYFLYYESTSEESQSFATAPAKS